MQAAAATPHARRWTELTIALKFPQPPVRTETQSKQQNNPWQTNEKQTRTYRATK
jgi:hypothetical protein